MAQKPVIDTSVFNNWPMVNDGQITSDGNYISYRIERQPAGSSTRVVRSFEKDWEKKIIGGSGSFFSADSRKIVVKLPGDSLGIFTLHSDAVDYLPNIRSGELHHPAGSDLLVYELSSPESTLVLQYLSDDGPRVTYTDVRHFEFSKDDTKLLVVTASANSRQQLRWIDLVQGTSSAIFQGEVIGNLIFDAAGEQLCFTSATPDHRLTFWYYKTGMRAAQLLVGNSEPATELTRPVAFNHDGSGIFFAFKRMIQPVKKDPRLASVDVWSYKDETLQSQQLHSLSTSGQSELIGFIGLSDRHIVQLIGEDETIVNDLSNACNPAYVLVAGRNADLQDWFWNPACRASVFLVSTIDGSRVQLNPKSAYKSPYSFQFSADGQYILYYDADEKNYFSYAIRSGEVANITSGIDARWTTTDDESISYTEPVGVAGFVKRDTSVLILSQEDVFKISLNGSRLPVNLTNNFGKEHNIVFRILSDMTDPNSYPKQQIILNAFNRNNKDNGFYTITLQQKGDPGLRSMQPFFWLGSPEDGRFGREIVKAKQANKYLLRGMDANSAPNFYVTGDFIHFRPVSDVHPEKRYNWLSTELITWKTFDGSLSQAILYKPEDFDPNKKYPVIFYYYERLSDGLHGFIYPEYNNGPMYESAPYYASHGYLICMPDIHYTIGHPGQSVVNTVVSCAKYLGRYPWVDTTKMGIQGHSRGGFETDFLITHTGLFAAAVSASGLTDYVSLYNGIKSLTDGHSGQMAFEIGHQRIGATLWQRPDLFIENSPIFHADKVTTPVLMLADKLDADIDFKQGIEFFTALRRLGKKSWLLQYDGQGHSVCGDAARDYTIRMQQFFDYYLKGALPPKWMTEGIPAARKGLISGLSPDTSGAIP